MSLQNLAKELEKKGRGKDRMLVHMTPKEVSGLQAIAKAHGGSLTVNPDTGLVEAGFLDDLLPSLLPMVAGAALASTGIGAPAAAMLVGGGYGLATGSVEKGLMAGLGAYGGAGIGESLAATAPIEQAATTQAATNAAQSGVIPQAPGAGTPGGLNALNSFDTGAVSQAMAPPTPGAPPVDYGISTAGGQTQAPLSFTQQTPTMSTAEAMKTIGSAGNVPTGTPSGYTFGQLKSGYANTDLGKFAAENYGKIGMAAAPVLSTALEPDPYVGPEEEKYTGGYRLSPNFKGYTPQRPNPYYRPTGLGYAEGGEVDKKEKAPAASSASSSASQTPDWASALLQLSETPGNGFAGRIANAVVNPTQTTAAPQVNALSYSIDPRTGQVYVPTGLGYAGYAGYAGGGQIPQLNNMPAGGLAALQGMRDGYGATQTMDGNIPQFAEGGQAKKPAKAKMTGARNIASMDPYEAAMAELNNARAGANMSQMNMPKAGLAELGALPYAAGGMASGRYLSGGGDGMSDSIPATINNKQPARLADGEFVVPADVVSHLGNGSSNAGAKKLYGMMDKVRTARTGKKKQAPAVKTDKYMPA